MANTYVTCNTSHFKLTDPAIKEMTDEEEQEDDNESTDGEQGTNQYNNCS